MHNFNLNNWSFWLSFILHVIYLASHLTQREIMNEERAFKLIQPRFNCALSALYTNGFLLVWYNKVGMVHCIYLGCQTYLFVIIREKKINLRGLIWITEIFLVWFFMSQSTAMLMSGQSVHLQDKHDTAHTFPCNWQQLFFRRMAVAIIWAVTRDFQQCGILKSVDSDKPVQPPFKLRNS